MGEKGEGVSKINERVVLSCAENRRKDFVIAAAIFKEDE
jgi:hypothetical protein